MEGIIRELYEEIGLSVNPNELKLFHSIATDHIYIRDIYVLNKDIPLEDLHFNDGEVIDCKYVTKEVLKEMAAKGECAFSLDSLIKLSPFYRG